VNDRVLHTREAATPLGDLLRARGLRPVHVPLIVRLPTGTPPPAGRPGLVLVTSAAAVAAAPRLAEVIGGAAVVAVGPTTADALRRAGVERVHVGTGGGAAAVAHAARLSGEVGGRFWHVRGAVTSRTVAAALAAHELQPDVWVAYATGPAQHAEADLRAAGPVDAVCFASGSAARAFATFASAGALRVAVIGPDTAAEARRVGLPVHAVAAQPDMPGLADAVLVALSGPSPG
jgi:uroporphyrinogen-III synthase